jgi:hypothetical protein
MNNIDREETMTKERVRRALVAMAAAAVTVGLGGAALAQGAPVNLRGEVKAVQGGKIMLAERSGQTVTLNLADNTPVGVLVPAKLEDVKQGRYIAVTAMPMPDGKLNARVVQLFMPGQRPAPGHRPWDLSPGSTMTNADVDGVVAGAGKTEIKVKYKDGEKAVVVTPNTSIIAVAPPDKSQLKPGAQAFAVGQKQADGSYNVVRISVGKDGLKPPM